jgi:hypothetical protein
MASTGEEHPQTLSNLGMYLSGLVAIALLTPTAFSYRFSLGGSYWSNEIMAMTWIQFTDYRGSILMTILTQPSYVFGAQILTFPRLIFIYMISRLYNEKTTTRRAVLTGIISELWLPGIYYTPLLLQAITAPSTIDMVTIAIPIPILLIAGLLLLRRRPAKGLPVAWAAGDRSEDWWDEHAGSFSSAEKGEIESEKPQ